MMVARIAVQIGMVNSMANTSVSGMQCEAVEPPVLAAEMSDVADQVSAEYARADLRPSGALQQDGDRGKTDDAAEEQDLERGQLRGKLAPGDRHRHERRERAGHPERGAYHRPKLSWGHPG